MGNKNQPEVVGALRRLHLGPGSHPSGSEQDIHAGNKGIGNRPDINDPDFPKGQFDVRGTPSSDAVVDALKDLYGVADDKTVAAWISPEGEYLAPNIDHQESARMLLERLNPELEKDKSDAEVTFIVVGSGMVRHTMFVEQHGFTVPNMNMPAAQEKAIVAMMELIKAKNPNAEFVFDQAAPSKGKMFGIHGSVVADILGLDRGFWTIMPITIRAIMPDHEIDIDEISYDWVSGLKDSGIHTVPIEPKDGIIAMPRARVEPKEEEVEKKSLLADVRRSLGGLMEALAEQYSDVARHGKHIGQEGRKGESGGSEPGFTHGEGVAVTDGSTNVDELGNKVGELKTLYGPNWDAGDDFILVKLDEYDGENWDVEVISGPSKENTIDFVGPNDLDEPHDDLLETWTTKSPVALEDRARDIFGLTDSIVEAGWILDNGDMLDFSGKREGGSPGMRHLDHRDIGRAFLDDEAENLITINYFADQTGAMRVSYFGPFNEGNTVVDIYRKPTQAQWDIVREMVSLSEDLAIDITDPSTATVVWSIQESGDLDRAVREARAQAAMKLKSMSALTLTFRHGKHIDQEGRKGEGKGGSEPGFTHAEGSAGGAGAGPSGADTGIQPGGARRFRELTDKEINTIKNAKNSSRDEIEKILEEAGWLGVEEETDYGQEVEQVASDLIEEAKEFEPEVTELMEGAAEDHGGEMAGLDFRLKGEKSYSRKISADMEEKGIGAEEAARAINDRVRYTMLFNGGEYVEKIMDVQESLSDDGYVQYDSKWKNYFRSGDPYDGYNTVMENPETGAKFELQFHTPETIEIKSKAHVIYEAFQASEEGSPMRKVFYDAMTDLWTDYEKPDNWENLPGVLK